MTTDRVRVDTLVRGEAGFSERVATMRVTSQSAHGWLVGVDADGRQCVMYAWEVLEPPRPERQRTDVPDRLRPVPRPRRIMRA